MLLLIHSPHGDLKNLNIAACIIFQLSFYNYQSITLNILRVVNSVRTVQSQHNSKFYGKATMEHVIEYGISWKGSQFSANQKREHTVFSHLIG